MSVTKPSLHLRIIDIAITHPGTIIHCLLMSILFITASLLTACTRSAAIEPYTTPTSSQQITIQQVQVIDGEGIYISGSSTLPSGECIETQLLEEGKAVTWWPEAICIQPDAGQWEMLASLGRDQAPNQLDPGHDYEVQAWWPKEEQKTLTRFPLDLQGPK